MDDVLKRHWHPVAIAKDLGNDAPVKSNIMGEEIVIWRSHDGLHAWKDQCPHRGSALSLGKVCNGRLRCAYHGWEFNVDGKCELIPANPSGKIPDKAKAMAIYQTREYAGLIWVCLSDAPAPFPYCKPLEAENIKIYNADYEMEVPYTRVIENFLDITHVPILHMGYLGTPNAAEFKDYEVEKTSDEGLFRVTGTELYQPTSEMYEAAEDLSDVEYSTDKGCIEFHDFFLLAPNVAYLITHIEGYDSGKKPVLLYPVRVVDEYHSVAYFCSGFNHDLGMTDEEIRSFMDGVMRQDMEILVAQRPKLIPKDTTEHTLLSSDATIVHYRRYLQKIGVNWGMG